MYLIFLLPHPKAESSDRLKDRKQFMTYMKEQKQLLRRKLTNITLPVHLGPLLAVTQPHSRDLTRWI